MKTKFTYIFALLFLFSTQIMAQESVKRFDNGITVATMTKTIPPVTNPKDLTLAPLLEIDFENKSKMLRSILDTKNKLSYDYSLEVVPMDNQKTFKVKFSLELESLATKISRMMDKMENEGANGVKPEIKEILSFSLKAIKEYLPMFQGYKTQTLPKYPTEVIVGDGDTIVLDILQDPNTGAKVQDLIRITKENKTKGYFVDLEPARDFSLNDLQMNLVDAQIFINDKLSNPLVLGQTIPINSSGSRIQWINIDQTIILSPTTSQTDKLEKIGTIEDNKLLFSLKGTKYKIVSKVPILGKTGKWNLWGKVTPSNEKIVKLLPPNMLPLVVANDGIEQN